METLSWLKRQYVVKFFIFLKFLYLFRALPIHIPSQDLKKMAKTFESI